VIPEDHKYPSSGPVVDRKVYLALCTPPCLRDIGVITADRWRDKYELTPISGQEQLGTKSVLWSEVFI